MCVFLYCSVSNTLYQAYHYKYNDYRYICYISLISLMSVSYGKISQTATTALQPMVADLPRAVRASITWDQGSEMARHADFTAATDIPVYFADPHSPWQRPTNENTNRLIREYLPKGTSFTDVTDTQVQAIQDRLNRRPRIVLNGQTPTEKLNDIINGANTT